LWNSPITSANNQKILFLAELVGKLFDLEVSAHRPIVRKLSIRCPSSTRAPGVLYKTAMQGADKNYAATQGANRGSRPANDGRMPTAVLGAVIAATDL
jgi:hypothetical protein